MALQEIELQLEDVILPNSVVSFLDEANARIDALFASEENHKYPKYLPSDAELLYRALAFLTEKNEALGDVFIEWGSGFGVATCLASLLGYESYGLEWEPELVEMSQDLATNFEIEVTILEASYLPEGYDSYDGLGGEELVRDGLFAYREEELAPTVRYEGMEFDSDQIDVFFVYPRPEEQEFMLELFEAVAVDGALLITYHGENDICAYRKV